MKIILHCAVIILGCALEANAAVVTLEQNITAFLNGSSGISRDVTFADGSIGSVTLRFTMTTLSGEGFTQLDGGGRVAVGPAPNGDDRFFFDAGEDVTFNVRYLSSTGTVDLTSIGFRFNQIGFRSGGTAVTNTWKVNSITVATFSEGSSTPGATEQYRDLDSAFTTIGTSPGLYLGTLSTTRQPNQISTSQFSSLVGGSNTDGLQFSVTYVPEPSAAALAAIGSLAMLRRRRCS